MKNHCKNCGVHKCPLKKEFTIDEIENVMLYYGIVYMQDAVRFLERIIETGQPPVNILDELKISHI